jgi:uncharacterized protein YkwD
MLRRLAIVMSAVLGLGLIAGSVGASPAPGVGQSTGSNISSSSYCADAESQEFLRLINSYRKKNGLGALSLSQTLSAAAQHHSNSMANNSYFSHNIVPEGITWSQNVKNHGYRYTTYRGENIAAGISSASGTFAQWKTSPNHNATMLSSKYKAIGIGRAYDASSKYGWYWTTDFGGKVDAKAKLC